MSALQGVIFITFDINTKEINFIRNDNITDYDTNVTNVYIQAKYKNSSGETIYLSADEITNYNFSLYTIKPLTNNVSEITGKVTNELIEQVRGGVIKFAIPKACTNRYGVVKCELHINKEKEMIASTRFILDVKQSLVTEFDDSLLEDSDFPVLQQLILEVQKVNNINDVNISKTTTFSSDKIMQEVNNKANKNEVFSMSNMGQDVKEAMTGGSVAVVGVNSILEPNIVNNQVTPVKTSFLKTGKNMLIGKRVNGGYVNWQTGEIISDSGYAHSDYIPVTPNTRISLNYHNALAFYDNSYNFVAGINGSGSNSKNYTLVNGEIEGQSKHGTYTVPTNACYIRVSSSIKYKDVQLELGEVSTSYEKPYYYIDGLIEMDNRNMFIKYDNEYTILTEKAKYIFKRVTDTSINVDAWRLYEGKLINDDGTEYTMWSNSDAEGAIQIVGEDDFVCGYHGDEKVETIDILIDGVPIDMSSNFSVSFKNLTIVSKSRVYHCNTSASASTQAFKRTKVLKFDSNKVVISNRFECLENLNINRASLALFQCHKSQDNTIIINKFSNNNDLILYDVPTSDTGTMPEQSVNMTQATFYTNCGVVDFKITKGYDHPKYMGYISNFNDQNRLKVYFDYIKGNTEVNVGDILQAEFEFSIT